jgi:hypothetical protein
VIRERFFLPLVVFATLTSGMLITCGLPSTTFLGPPRLPGLTSLGPPTARRLYFSHNPDNDIDDFEGYDLWYKLYATDANGEALLASDESHIESTPRQPGSGRLQTRGFRRAIAIKRDGNRNPTRFDDNAPHVEMGKTGSSIVFELDLRPPISRSDPIPPADQAEIVVIRTDNGSFMSGLRRRNTSAATVTEPLGDGGFHTFWNPAQYAPADLDVYTGLLQSSSETPDDFIIVLYAISVGLDRSGATFSRFYSEPVRLDPAQITFP